MDDKWLILIVAAMAHIYFALSFTPIYWEPLKRNGPGFWTLVAPLGLPVILAFVLLLNLAENWSGLPAWIQFVGGLGVGAASANLIISVRILRAVKTKSA